LVRAARVEGAGGVEGVIAGVTYRIGRADFARALGPDGAPGSARRAAAAWSRFDDLIRARAGAGTGTGIGVGTGIGHAVLADADGPLAVFIFSETIRSDAREFAAQVRGGGAQLILLSGDRREAVARVASALDVEQWYANQTPDSKRQLIGQMQNEGHVVAMLGDGMNDAPVLAQADVSIALAEGSSLAQARADFIVVSARLSEVAQVFDGARRVMRIIRQNLAGAFVYNMSVIPLAAFGYLTPALAAAGIAASSLLVVANALRARRV
jgi:Cu2+-exporting ATPase